MKSDSLLIMFSGEHRSGRKLFDSLLDANSSSFWNHSFITAMESLKYTGFVRPSTLFVSAPPHHLESIRSAYSKRMLKSPPGITITSLGDMGSIREVEQLHFIPLSDAFLDAVSHLNRSARPANIESVKQLISSQCDQLAPPTTSMLIHVASALAKEGQIRRIGNDLYVTPTPPKSTVECQTGDSILIVSEVKRGSNGRDGRDRKNGGIFSRLFSKKNTNNSSPVKKNDKRSSPPAVESSSLPDWEYRDRVYNNDRILDRIQSNSPSYNKERCLPSSSSPHHKKRRERDNRRREVVHNQYNKWIDSNESDIYPNTNYGYINPSHKVKKNQEKRPSRRQCTTVPISHKARASTPIESSDSAYSRSPSEHSDDAVDHTYVNIYNNDDETLFEECTIQDRGVSPMHIRIL